MSKLRILTLVAIFTIFNTGCISTIVKNSVKDSKVGNWIGLHKNPRVGDYSILKDTSGNTQMKLKIISKTGGLFIVRSETGVVLPGGLGIKNILTMDLYVDRKGKVKRAFIIDGTEKTPLQIAKKSDPEYLVPIKLTAAQKENFNLSNSITVPSGTYKVKLMSYKNMEKEKEQYIINMTNNRVKFLYVASYIFTKDDNGNYQSMKALELTEQGNSR